MVERGVRFVNLIHSNWDQHTARCRLPGSRSRRPRTAEWRTDRTRPSARACRTPPRDRGRS
jgi:hypothetical protein